jgi:hypothetical protein
MKSSSKFKNTYVFNIGLSLIKSSSFVKCIVRKDEFDYNINLPQKHKTTKTKCWCLLNLYIFLFLRDGLGPPEIVFGN